MTATDRDGDRHDLREELAGIEEARAHWLGRLTGGAGRPLESVTWLSAHTAAAQHVVTPLVGAVLRDRHEMRALSRDAVEVERNLRLLERFHSGDATVARLDGEPLRRSLVEASDAHAARFGAVLDLLAAALSPAEQRDVVERYREALDHAPTRPHPHAPHSGPAGAIAFRVNAARDRVLDGLDSRDDTVPHSPRAPAKETRWGDYWIGRSEGAAEDQH